MNKQLRRLMAYVYMPLIFTLAGFVTVYIAARPIIDVAMNIGSMVISQEVPDFDENLNSIFKEPQPDTETQATVDSASIEYPSDGDLYGKVECERIGLSGPLYMGDTKAILKAGIGQYNGSFVPGYGRPIMLAAHNTTYFRPLEHIQVGDIITITTSYGIYQYSVTNTAVALATETNTYDLGQEKEQLIMYTCYPFDMLTAAKAYRMFVYADKISGPDIK